MQSRVWLAVAFVVAFCASPAQAGAGRLKRGRTHRLPDAIVAVLQNAGAGLFCVRISLEARTTKLDGDGKQLSEVRGCFAAG
jgi:hypothetical protein